MSLLLAGNAPEAMTGRTRLFLILMAMIGHRGALQEGGTDSKNKG
jgi:hypothetical protein